MGTYYITTAIDYVNAKPHLGHAYEKIAADCLARYQRLRGNDVFFLTGTDENAQKNVQAAREAKKDVRTFVDEMAENFKQLCKAYAISYDKFIRTTDPEHHRIAQLIFKRLQDAGDIYKDKYTGLYCTGCEAFYTEKDLVAGKCPEHQTKPQEISEENYFFRLSKYRDWVKQHIESYPEFIQPETRRREILSRLADEVKDVSVSRAQRDWGVVVPGDPQHRIYVWVEALMNYVTALTFPEGDYKTFWPADVHLIGTGINWFHTVIWPAILLSAKIPLPKHVFVHGYLTADGQKMSKSIGNVVDPMDLVTRYPADALRYYLLRRVPFGEDGDFSESDLKNAINGELLAGLGNLLNRAVTLAEQYKGTFTGSLTLPQKLDVTKIEFHMDRFELHHTLETIFQFIGDCNKYVDETKPWKLTGTELGTVLNNLLESLRFLTIVLAPFIPRTTDTILLQLGVKRGMWKDLQPTPFTGKPKKGTHLFSRV